VHEAGLLAAAVAEALAAAGPGQVRPDAILIRIHDPIHLAPEAVLMHAELALRARGLVDVPIEVTADPVTCVACDAVNEAHADHPFCDECGWPLPDKGGHQVEAVARWPAVDPAGAVASPAPGAGALA
jgi:hypothetical protein